MADRYRITLAQLNPTVGDLRGNAEKVIAAHDRAREAGSDLLALPEMFITGYQTQDLVMKPAFVRDVARVLADLAARCADGPDIAIGGPLMEGGKLYNAYFILRDGRVDGAARKHRLPNTDVFDEMRLYTPGPISGPFGMGPLRLGTPICEDSWHPDVAETMAESGADLLLVPNGSPYAREKIDERMGRMVARVIENDLPLIYLNMVGGQDDQVFDGGSFVLNRGGKLAVMLPVFDEAVVHVDFEHRPEGWVALDGLREVHPPLIEQDYRLMVEATRDYLRKSGFSRVLLGLSGGVDSALVAAIAADAIGPANVRCVMLPSDYTSGHSLEDAAAVARALGCPLDTVPITPAFAAVQQTLAPLFEGKPADLTEENMQSRLRGLMLMALSNKFGEMLLTTGNKSEVAVGYATIYGDMAGGYNPIKDLYKTRVFATCRWRNENHRPWMLAPEGVVIPPRVIEKPPSAELRPDQKDEDSLPPYEVLDAILELLVDRDASVADCVDAGFDRATVKQVERLIYLSEYKRFQAAPGARLTGRAFWLDRRYPIVNRWRDDG
ncbi:NAD+ synthase [Halovulum dunhuangense]|uniref:Glutamine-dependent NAD(+) synthetase n=1 Tax=Halovulum dunhuangense TaxID=1505036 RepID=A0A849L0X1_9RHOB|nr:NAD+ synthase [Halovulum dunhuangense]NNU79911.1 NAD+ synthase [Halovulum dunhuangense]